MVENLENTTIYKEYKRSNVYLAPFLWQKLHCILLHILIDMCSETPPNVYVYLKKFEKN